MAIRQTCCQVGQMTERLLVCGGRKFSDVDLLNQTLNYFLGALTT